MSILKQVKGMSEKEAEAFLQALVAQASARNKLTLKVSQKGALSLYGIQKFPVTYYKSQWERILGEADAIRAFIAANSAEKPDADGKDADGKPCKVKTYLVDKE